MYSFQRIAGPGSGYDLLKIILHVKKRAHQFGGNTAVVRPVPIPNTAVKHCKADGSGCIASARVGSRQSFKLKPGDFSPGFLLPGIIAFTKKSQVQV